MGKNKWLIAGFIYWNSIKTGIPKVRVFWSFQKRISIVGFSYFERHLSWKIDQKVVNPQEECPPIVIEYENESKSQRPRVDPFFSTVQF